MPVLLLVGTREGTFVLKGDSGRNRWTTSVPFSAGEDVYHAVFDPRDLSVWTAVNSPVWGARLQVTRDLERTWSRTAVRFRKRPHTEPSLARRARPRRRAGRHVCRGRARRSFQEQRRRRILGRDDGVDRPSDPTTVVAGLRRAMSAQHDTRPNGERADVGRYVGGRRLRDRGRR